MKKIIALLVLAGASWAVQASDWVDYPQHRAQNLPTNRIQVINFWATWCQPCRKEMPDLSNWYAKSGKKQNIFMVGIALDTPENMAKFLKETPVHYPIWQYTGADSRAMMKSFGNAVGALPYTVVRAPHCHYEAKIIGEVNAARLNQAVQSAQAVCRKA